LFYLWYSSSLEDKLEVNLVEFSVIVLSGLHKASGWTVVWAGPSDKTTTFQVLLHSTSNSHLCLFIYTTTTGCFLCREAEESVRSGRRYHWTETDVAATCTALGIAIKTKPSEKNLRRPFCFKCFILYGKPHTKSQSIIISFTDLFLCIISTSKNLRKFEKQLSRSLQSSTGNNNRKIMSHIRC
jgi:hypothetical protein